MDKFKGVAVCKLVNTPWGRGVWPSMPEGCTFRRVGEVQGEPPQCTVQFTTHGDRLAEFEAHPGVLSVSEYEQAD